MVAAFWHITPMAGVGILAASLAGLVVYLVGVEKVYRAEGIA